MDIYNKIIIISSIVAIISSLLNIFLFIKLWTMTNHVSDIRDIVTEGKELAPKEHNYTGLLAGGILIILVLIVFITL